jgi:4-hydroxymandelate oxidase
MFSPMPHPLSRIPPEVVAVTDYVPLARERMTPEAWAYLEGGAADEITLRENRAAFDRLRLRPRVLRDLAGAHTRTTFAGRILEHPIFVAPVAYQRLAHPEGERAMALGAGAARAGVVVSAQASVELEVIAPEARAGWWMQLYLYPDRIFLERLVRRAEAAGCEAFVVTVDAPVSGVRHREWRAGFRLPVGVDAVNLRGLRGVEPAPAPLGESPLLGGSLARGAATWKDFAWLRSITRLPVWVKGILSAEDALRALAEGADGLIVSNHGGRTLDTLPATLEVLPEIAGAAGGRAPVLLDGGVRRGTDVFKAIALGASGVLVGRPVIHGLAAAGAPGVAHVLQLLRAEFEATMALCGCASPAEITRDRIRTAAG